MDENIRSTNLRFNLQKEIPRRAWQYLQMMDKARFKSYSSAMAVALVDYFNRYYRAQDNPYFESREREERFVQQIITAVGAVMEKSLPLFLAGCMAGMGKLPQTGEAFPAVQLADSQPDAAADVDWDFLGG